MTSAYSSMDPTGLHGQYDMPHAGAAARSMMLHSPPPQHFVQQQQQQRQSPSTRVYHPGASQLAPGYGGPGPGSAGAGPGYMVAPASTPGVSPGAGTPTSDAPAKRDRDSIYGYVRLQSCSQR